MSVNLLAGRLGTLGVAGGATFVVAVSEYGDSSHPTLLTAELLALLLLHTVRYLRVWIGREVLLYAGLLAYSALSISWTENMHVAVNTLPSMTNFLLVLALFGSLAAYHEVGALLIGCVTGFGLAAVLYTLTSGFPFSYPEGFSYNTIAGMYLFGLFSLAVLGAYLRWLIVPLAGGVLLLVLITATTSIKTNLGLALGVTGATLFYFKPSATALIRGLLVVGILATGAAYAVRSNPAVEERVRNGFARVSLGVAVLTNREGDSGTTGLGNRQGWEREGLRGWAANPVFGSGMEAFRADFGTTSHSTPIDLLYNYGLIGLTLFYGLYGSIALRLLKARNPIFRSVRARLTAALIAYAFISLSATIYYEAFIAMFVALSTVLIVRLEASMRGSDGALIPALPNRKS
jgi:O-antigen ligase